MDHEVSSALSSPSTHRSGLMVADPAPLPLSLPNLGGIDIDPSLGGTTGRLEVVRPMDQVLIKPFLVSPNSLSLENLLPAAPVRNRECDPSSVYFLSEMEQLWARMVGSSSSPANPYFSGRRYTDAEPSLPCQLAEDLITSGLLKSGTINLRSNFDANPVNVGTCHTSMSNFSPLDLLVDKSPPYWNYLFSMERQEDLVGIAS